MWSWADVLEDTGNDSPEEFWTASYAAIAAANLALKAVDKFGNPESLDPQVGEALVARAYNHFCLVNVFAKHYSKLTGDTDLGIPYVTEPENTVDVDLQRLSVAEVYELIEKDLLAGLPLIDDNAYVVPKYHFNIKAAYAFATRYYLYKGDWDNAIKYATLVLGDDPRAILRDWSAFPSLPSGQPRAQHYARMEHKTNLLVSCPVGSAYTLGNFASGKKFSHAPLISDNETVRARMSWCPNGVSYYNPSSSYSGGRYTVTLKLPYFFHYSDPIARIGLPYTQIVVYTAEEVLLARAEASIMKQEYENALRDMNLWITTTSSNGAILSRESVNDYYTAQVEYTPEKPTPKKKLNPETPFASTEQENFAQCIIQMRRVETIHEGQRWFDVKRYGIEIVRRELGDNGRDVTVLDELKVNDPRRAIQLPAAAINAGLLPNPRVK
jgi:hypothetical protein